MLDLRARVRTHPRHVLTVLVLGLGEWAPHAGQMSTAQQLSEYRQEKQHGTHLRTSSSALIDGTLKKKRTVPP